MKSFFALFFLISPLMGNAQITLEQTYYDGTAGFLGFGENGYQTINTTSGNWVMYNENHQPIRTIVIPTINGFTMGGPSYYGTEIFSNNGEFRYMVTYFDYQSGERVIRIYNESNSQLFTKSCNNCTAVVGNVNGNAKLLVFNADWSEIYSLPGVWPFAVNVQEPSFTSSFNMYPNPSNQLVTIDTPEQGTMELFSTGGQIIRTFPVSGGESISFPVSDLASGTYIVRINGEFSERLIVR